VVGRINRCWLGSPKISAIIVLVAIEKRWGTFVAGLLSAIVGLEIKLIVGATTTIIDFESPCTF